MNRDNRYFLDVPSGGKREGAGRPKGWKPEKPVDSIQVTTRIKRETLRRLKAEAERRIRPGRKRSEIGKVIDDLAKKHLTEGGK